MSAEATINGAENIPAEPTLVIPNRVDPAALVALEEALGGGEKVAWMIEHRLRPDAEVINTLLKHKASGFTIPPRGMNQEPLMRSINAMFAAGRHVVLLPGRPAQAPASLADTTPELLHQLLDAYPRAVLPVYVGMYRMRHAPLAVTEKPYDKLAVSICPALQPGGRALSGVTEAWMNASADQASQMTHLLHAPADQPADRASATLPHALLRSLLSHPNAVILDGVDNKQMTYNQLLIRAATLARQLRMHVASKRIGIILPPGKYSIIANVACLLAGITPVNIDYNFNSAAYESVAAQAGLDRLITENRFIEMQQEFPWPLTRDILFIDALPEGSRQHVPLRWRLLRRALTPAYITKWICTPDTLQEQDEALVIYSAATGSGEPRGTALSHRAVLAGAALSNSRFCLKAGQRVLSALPYYHPAGLLLGLIYPLLAGQDIVTYSLPEVGKRLGELALRHHAALAAFTPRQAAEVLATAAEGDFAHTTYFLVMGKATEHTLRLAQEKHHIHPCECYLPQECAMPVACNMPPPAAEDGRPALPCAAPDTMGLPLPGVAVRISDLDDPLNIQPLGTQGLVWVKGCGMVSDTAGSSPRPPHERWLCTGDVGCLREDGMLVVHGPRTRFSQIEGEIIFHGKVEQLMAKYLHVADQPGPPRLAVLGVQDEQTGLDKLILLSTVHKVLGPHDLITLHYALSNDHQSKRMTPSRIIPLRSIPTLPDGQVDYPRCMSIYRYIQRS